MVLWHCCLRNGPGSPLVTITVCNTLKDTTQEFYGLKTALRKGVLITLIRELEVNTDTVYRSWHQVSKEGPKFLSAKNFRLLPWKKKN